MAEQQQSGSTPQKSASEVKPSQARAEAEASQSQTRAASTHSGSSQGAKTDKPKSKGDGERAHPMQGRSLEYSSGPGAEAYSDGMYSSDEVNKLDHFNR